MQRVAIQAPVPGGFLQGRLIGFESGLQVSRAGQCIAAVIGGFRIFESLQLFRGGGVISRLHLGVGATARVLEQGRGSGRLSGLEQLLGPLVGSLPQVRPIAGARCRGWQ